MQLGKMNVITNAIPTGVKVKFLFSKKDWKSFTAFEPSSQMDIVCDSRNWPEGVRVRAFRPQRGNQQLRSGNHPYQPERRAHRSQYQSERKAHHTSWQPRRTNNKRFNQRSYRYGAEAESEQPPRNHTGLWGRSDKRQPSRNSWSDSYSSSHYSY